jgi:hypothetical protein
MHVRGDRGEEEFHCFRELVRVMVWVNQSSLCYARRVVIPAKSCLSVS